MKRNLIFCLPLILCLMLNGCATFYNPVTGKKETVLIDTSSEVSLGRNFSADMEKKLKLDSGKDANKRVQSIGNKIVLNCDRQDLAYQFKVVQDKQINAFALPGGFIYVNSGLLEKVNDDELAAVIAHEVGHVVERHGVKKLQAGLGFNILMSLILGGQNEKELRQMLDLGFNILSKGYSREDEYQADKLGVKYAYLSGYNPDGMVTLFEKLMKQYGDVSGFEVWMSDHPPLSKRIEKAKEEIPKYKNQSK